MSRKALITGITGQDGSYLADLLLDKGYEVHGIIRRSSSFNTARIDHAFNRLQLHYGDMLDASHLTSLMHRIQPDEVYNLAAQSHVAVSFELPIYTGEAVGIGTAILLEAIRSYRDTTGASVRMYQASSSEMYGTLTGAADESTPFRPMSPYAAAKTYAHHLCVNYREAYDLHVSCGILFNHESPRRGETFVTRKITRAVGRIKCGLQDCVRLGNIESRRDWGHAADYVRAMWLMLQQDAPDDYVVATGRAVSVRWFADQAFACAGLGDSRGYIVQDERYMRPTDVTYLLGNPAKARDVLGWEPEYGAEGLVRDMVNHDMRLAQNEAIKGAA